MVRKALFLDRDGILNRERGDYVKSPEELEILAGIDAPIKRIRERDYLIVVVTNQSVVGRGLITEDDLGRIHSKLRTELEGRGCRVDAVYYCPHTSADGCACRKPKPGMILKAAEELGIDLKDSWLIGDQETDVEAARRAGVKGILVPSNDDGLKIGVNQILKTSKLTEWERHLNGDSS